MISCRRSSARRKNPALVEQKRTIRPSVARALPKLLRKGESADGALVLIGGADLLHFQIRVAQSHLRHDMTPSYWSHVAVAMRCDTGLELHEVALDPPGGFADMPARNGIQTVPLDRYDDRNRFPNLAVLRFPIEESSGETVCDAILKVQRERGLLDLTALVLPWLGYVWGAGLPANPLLSGNGMPSAAFAEAVFAALGVELTPGLATKASCPEAIWQAARWWHQYYEKPLPPEVEKGRQVATPHGLYWVGQRQACLREL